MRTIAVINQKGGVGKTTTAVNLSAALAQRGQRVCLIDLDPQAHATLHLGMEELTSDRSVYNVLTGDACLAEIARAVHPTLFVIGSHIDVAAVEVELAEVEGRELILRDQMETLRGQYDYVVLDCPPSLGILTLNALCAVQEVFLPLQPHFLALHGLSKLLETIDVVSARLNGQLRLTGIVLCMYESGTRLAAEVSENARAFLEAARDHQKPWSGAGLFATRIRRNIRLAEAPSFGQSIFEYAPSSNGAVDYAQLSAEVMGEPVGMIVSDAA